ncbi:MAG: aminotransferase class V-fold PLP-dependent enzyme, partial [Candidatus Latescibacterota bacterium]|nr:aminotransferase class V-fold PLP-dependent enzyme [Candidatus Latescibacterota bacterium]
ARALLHAGSTNEIVYVRGTTEAINLVASSYGGKHVGSGDEILVTEMEHHSNIVPWQLLCERSGAVLRVAPIDDSGELILDSYRELLSDRTRIVAITHISNALGTVNPVREITEMAHAAGAVVLVDGAQGAPHTAVDVTNLGCDFYAFSGHKLYGPTGIGVLYGREALLDAMPP